MVHEAQPSPAQPSRPSFTDRLWAKIAAPRLDNGTINYEKCWDWTGCFSQSGRRGVFYGNIRLGRPDKTILRVNRVMLLMYPNDPNEIVPREDGESFEEWLRRANNSFRHAEASHSCDNARCPNPTHLSWKDHADNVSEQRERRQSARNATRRVAC